MQRRRLVNAIRKLIARLTNLYTKLFGIGRAVGTHRIRIFSFCPPGTSTHASYDSYVPQSIERLARLTELAVEADFILLLENEKDIVTEDTYRLCYDQP